MKIVNARTHLVEIPTKRYFGKVRASGFGSHATLDTVVLELETDSDLVGIGEFASMLQRRGRLLLAEFELIYRDRLIGRDPRDFRAIMLELEAALDGGHVTRAGIEMALIDLCGKAMGVPAYALLGGKCRDAVPLSYSIPWGGPEEVAALASERVADGYQSIKIKVGRDRETDVATVGAVRAAIGPDVPLRVDANARWSTPKDALATIHLLEPFDVTAVEQPLAAHDLEGHALLRQRVAPKIMLDEGIWTSRDLLRAIQAHAIDAVSVYVTEAGGMWEGLSIFNLAEAAGLPCAMGSMPESGIGTAAQIHLGLAAPKIGYPCDTCGTNYLADDITTGAGDISSGLARPNDRPGLGVELDVGKLNDLTVDTA